MDAKAKAVHARAALNDEIVQLAFTETLEGINKALLSAKTPEERERHWNAYHGLNAAWQRLKKWPIEAEMKQGKQHD